MTAQLYRHIKDWPTDKLRVVLEFFDHEHVRHWYTGLISDIRGELDRRGETVCIKCSVPLREIEACTECGYGMEQLQKSETTEATYESAMAQLDRLGVPR